jgi:Cdc6-like AAA superfamily ATPase
MKDQVYVLLKGVLSEELFPDLIKGGEFYLEKGREVFIKYENYSKDEVFYQNILDKIKNIKTPTEIYDDLLDKDSEEYKFLVLVGKLYAYLDKSGYNRPKWVEYENRSGKEVANTGIRNPMYFINNLVIYKLNGNDDTKISANIKNALRFIREPDKNLSIVSEDMHRRISEKILEKDYNPETFMNDIFEFFKPLNVSIENDKNLGRYYSMILGEKSIKKLWEKSNSVVDKKNETDSKDKIQFNGYQISLKNNLNIILYGPPGTGKTYYLKNHLFMLFTDENAQLSKEEFCNQLVRDLAWWQIISIVVIDLKETDVQKIYSHPLLQAKIKISQNATPKNTIWAFLQRHTKDDCPNVKFTKRDSPQFFWKDEKGNWSIDLDIVKSETPDFLDLLDRYNNDTLILISEKRYIFTTFHQSFSYEDFIEGIKPNLVKKEDQSENEDIGYHIKPGIFREIVERAINNKEKKYALFIDEINRGNIASIFGELITLIEEDKRDNEITVTLPYSKDKFGVPSNLYIIGTMNTADRSVEALDTALRRRFTFIEMNPKPDLLSKPEYKCEGLNLEKMLLTINNRLEKLLDKDHCIGHSYFMTIKNKQNPNNELKTIFLNKILPLLQEYFYGDWGKIMLVLGEGFVGLKTESINFLGNDASSDYEEFENKPVYYFKESKDWTLSTFRGIYESS